MPAALFGVVVLVVCVVAVSAFAAATARRRRELAAAVASTARENASIDVLIGAVFDRVRYVGDLPQLVFEGALPQVMSLDALPTVVQGSSILRAGQPGHRQALAALHGKTVFVSRISSEGELVLEFDEGALIVEPTI